MGKVIKYFISALTIFLLGFMIASKLPVRKQTTDRNLQPQNTIDPDYIFTLVSKFREASGLNTLIRTPLLCEIANDRARYIVEKNSEALRTFRPEIAHEGFEQFQKRYPGTFLSENWNTKYYTTEQVVTGWLTSKGHLENILYPPFGEACVATYEEVNVLILGQP